MTTRIMNPDAERFVAGWLRRNVDEISLHSDHAELVERLVVKLEHAAWGYGMERRDFRMAVGDDAYGHILDAIAFRNG